MATLILVSKSPYFTKDDTYAFEASLNLRKMDEEVGLMLIQDAVLSAIREEKGLVAELLKNALDVGVNVYVLNRTLKLEEFLRKE